MFGIEWDLFFRYSHNKPMISSLFVLKQELYYAPIAIHKKYSCITISFNDLAILGKKKFKSMKKNALFGY